MCSIQFGKVKSTPEVDTQVRPKARKDIHKLLKQAQKKQAADSMLTMLRPDGGQIFNLAACSPKRHSA